MSTEPPVAEERSPRTPVAHGSVPLLAPRSLTVPVRDDNAAHPRAPGDPGAGLTGPGAPAPHPTDTGNNLADLFADTPTTGESPAPGRFPALTVPQFAPAAATPNGSPVFQPPASGLSPDHTGPGPATPAQGRRAAYEEEARRWAAQFEQLAEPVEVILAAISDVPILFQTFREFVLTADPVIDATQRRQFEQMFSAHTRRRPNLAPGQVQAAFDLAYDDYIGLGPLGPLWRDDEVTEILVDSWDRIAVERNGTLTRVPHRFRDAEHAADRARKLADMYSNRGLSPTNPIVTAELPGARVHINYGPIVRSGLSISIRKFRALLGMDALVARGALTPEMREFLDTCVAARANILVSGGTGTGKTTAINAISEAIPDHERVVTIEDSFELQINTTHVVPMQTKERASADDAVAITQADLLVSALRMRPDRIVVGEIREGGGATVMLEAASTGHDGTMTTIHANTTYSAMNDRLSDLVRSHKNIPDDVAKRQAAGAIDLVIQVSRRLGRRYISEIAVVDRTCIDADGNIRPVAIFTGAITEDGTGGPVRHQRVGSVPVGSQLAVKLADTHDAQATGRWISA